MTSNHDHHSKLQLYTIIVKIDDILCLKYAVLSTVTLKCDSGYWFLSTFSMNEFLSITPDPQVFHHDYKNRNHVLYTGYIAGSINLRTISVGRCRKRESVLSCE